MKKKIEFKIREVNEKDKEWIRKFTIKEWGSEKIIGCRKVYFPHKLPGFVAVANQKYLGLITYAIRKEGCELVSFNALKKGRGIGTALLERIKKFARRIGCKRVFLVTTNDNIDSLLFYQKKGFIIKKFYPDAIAAAREIKPEIPMIGNYGIPIRDTLELEIILN